MYELCVVCTNIMKQPPVITANNHSSVLSGDTMTHLQLPRHEKVTQIKIGNPAIRLRRGDYSLCVWSERSMTPWVTC